MNFNSLFFIQEMDITWDDQLSAPQQISQKKLINILDSINGKKDLIIESKLIKILDSFIGAKTLRYNSNSKNK